MTTIILDRKVKGTHEIRVRDKETNESVAITIISKNDTIHTLKDKIKKWLRK